MTQEFVMLPREVVKQVIAALGNTETESAEQYKIEYLAIETLRAVLEQKGEQDESAYQCGYREGVVKGREELIAEYPLDLDLYDSKDWRCGSYAERIEWLHTMYESAREWIAELEQQVEQEPAVILAFYDGVREPRLLSWNQLPSRQHLLYTHPQPRQVPLTEADIQNLLVSGDYLTIAGLTKLVRAIERAHHINHEGEEA